MDDLPNEEEELAWEFDSDDSSGESVDEEPSESESARMSSLLGRVRELSGDLQLTLKEWSKQLAAEANGTAADGESGAAAGAGSAANGEEGSKEPDGDIKLDGDGSKPSEGKPAEDDKPAEDGKPAGDAPPATGEAAPATGEAARATGEAAPATGEAAPATGEAAPAPGEAAPAPGEAAPAPGEAAPATGEAAPATGEAAPAPGEAAPATAEAAPAEATPAEATPAPFPEAAAVEAAPPAIVEPVAAPAPPPAAVAAPAVVEPSAAPAAPGMGLPTPAPAAHATHAAHPAQPVGYPASSPFPGYQQAPQASVYGAPAAAAAQPPRLDAFGMPVASYPATSTGYYPTAPAGVYGAAPTGYGYNYVQQPQYGYAQQPGGYYATQQQVPQQWQYQQHGHYPSMMQVPAPAPAPPPAPKPKKKRVRVRAPPPTRPAKLSDVKPLTRAELAAMFPTDCKLTRHQVVGVNWAFLLYAHGHSAMLADEMGLGKTVQSLALFAVINSRLGTKGPHLIVAPASTLEQWRRESAKWLPAFSAVLYTGSAKNRRTVQADWGHKPGDILITSFSIFERDSATNDRAWLKKLDLHMVVIDEAHAAKNIHSSRFQRLMRVKVKSRLLLSGTPVNNTLPELFALLRFAMPDLREDDLRLFDKHVRDADSKLIHQIRALLEPFCLRRLKVDVITDLPPKEVHVERLVMTPAQKQLYQDVVKRSLGEAVLPPAADGSAPVVVVSDSEGEGEGDEAQPAKRRRAPTPVSVSDDPVAVPVKAAPKLSKRKLQHMYTELRRAANHPALSRRFYTQHEDKFNVIATELHGAAAFGTECSRAQVVAELLTYSDYRIHRLCLEYAALRPQLASLTLPEDMVLCSAKFNYLKILLPDLVSKGRRFLIFSQWTQCLDVLESLLIHMAIKYLRFDGSTAVASRSGIVDLFTNDDSFPCMLLSTRAGGLGVNLTAADTVILHDLDHNPTHDLQAEDRVHRIGQTKAVSVYRLVTKGTIEEHIVDIQDRKKALKTQVLRDDDRKKSRRRKQDETVDVATLLMAALGED